MGGMSQTPTSYQPYTPGRPGPEDRPDRVGCHHSRRRGAYPCSPDGLGLAAVACVAIWALTGFGYFWPIWVLLPALFLGGFSKKN
jgi:hypothetical protein